MGPSPALVPDHCPCPRVTPRVGTKIQAEGLFSISECSAGQNVCGGCVCNHYVSLCKLGSSKVKQLNWHIDHGPMIYLVLTLLWWLLYLFVRLSSNIFMTVGNSFFKKNNKKLSAVGNSFKKCPYLFCSVIFTVPVYGDWVCRFLKGPNPHSHHLRTPVSGSCQTSETGAV